MVAHVVSVLHAVVDEVVVVASESLELPDLDAKILRDREPELGPLAGIREGLEGMDAEFAYVTGTDAPFLTPAFVKSMLAYGCAAAAEVDGYVQTMAAVYPRDASREINAMLAAGRPRPLHLLEALDYRKIAADALPDLDSVRGFNTPGEYLDAVRQLEKSPTAHLEVSGSLQSQLNRSEFEVPVGTLAEILAVLPASLGVLDGDRIADGFCVSLSDHGRVSSTAIPIGPGERVLCENSAHDHGSFR
jgi:molybdopterin-guanine dinucleotide biosynthesis protein A